MIADLFLNFVFNEHFYLISSKFFLIQNLAELLIYREYICSRETEIKIDLMSIYLKFDMKN